MLWLEAECLLKIKLLFAVVFLIHFAFVIQHSNVDHKGEKPGKLTKTKMVCISVNYQELFSVQSQSYI